MSADKPRERLEITLPGPEKRVLLRWSRRMGVSVGTLLQYCFIQAQDYIREQIETLADDARDADADATEGEISDRAHEALGALIRAEVGPAL